jgi:hypothetical protein
MGGSVLLLNEQQRIDLQALNGLRDDIEHVKPANWSIQVAGLPRIMGSAAEALGQLFEMGPVRLHLSDAELDSAIEAIAALKAWSGVDPFAGEPTFE